MAVYLAEHDLKPGTSVADKVVRELQTSDAAVFLITANSVESAYVQQEIGIARAYGKPLVPIVEKGIERKNLGMLAEVERLVLDLEHPAEALTDMTASLQPLILKQSLDIDVAVSVSPAPPLSNQLLILGLGVLLGFLVSAMILNSNNK